jgi:hypothetical protein
MREYLIKVRRRLEAREHSAEDQVPRKRDARIVKIWKAVKFFNSDSPLFIGPGRGSSAKLASIQPSLISRTTRVPSDVPRVTFLLNFRMIRGIGSSESTRFPEGLVLGNSGKPVTLETSNLTKFLKHVFQEQGIHDFRKPGACEASNSQMCEVRGSRFGEDTGSRTCKSSVSRTVGDSNFGGRPVRESVEG